MGRLISGDFNGWLDTGGICHYNHGTHEEWASRYLNIPLPTDRDSNEYLDIGVRVVDTLYKRGWARIVIHSATDTIEFDTLTKNWRSMTYKQRGWIYDIATKGYKIYENKIVSGKDIKDIPLIIKMGIDGSRFSPDQILNLESKKISFYGMLKTLLTERMSFRDLFNASDPARIERSDDVRVISKPMDVDSIDQTETWIFSYKSYPSTTGYRWKGNIKFFKENISGQESASDIDCMVDCECFDYRYRYAYANAKQDASTIGPNSLNRCINSPPIKMNPGENPGLCKHLLALGEYLKTNIDPTAPETEDNPDRPSYDPNKVVSKYRPSIPSTSTTQPIAAPLPDNSYSDSRSGTLTETKSKLYGRIEQFVRKNPKFIVNYYD